MQCRTRCLLWDVHRCPHTLSMTHAHVPTSRVPGNCRIPNHDGMWGIAALMRIVPVHNKFAKNIVTSA